jgi:hypothetical protein
MIHSPPSGRTAVIVANGPSVDAVPAALWRRLRSLDGVLLIGTNRSLAFAALGGVSPHAMVIRDTYRNLWHDQHWGARYHEQLWKPCPCWKVGPADRRVTHCDEFVRFAGGWQDRIRRNENGESAVLVNSSVALMAANWAFLRGARELFFVGLDYYGAHPRMIPPYDQAEVGWQGQYDRPVPRRVEQEFASAVVAVHAAGGRMRNLSSGSHLRAMPPANWTDIPGL